MTARQHIRRMLAACLLLFILAACSEIPSGNPASTPASSADGGRNPATLVLWHAWPSPDQRALATLVERYNRSNKPARIILQAKSLPSLTSELRGAALEGSGPHIVIVQSHTIGALAADGLLLALDGLVSPAEHEQLLPSAVGGAYAADAAGATHLYGMPLTFDTLVLYYNRANWNVPPSDTDAMLGTARGLSETTVQPHIWGLAYTLSLDKTMGYFYAFGGRIFDDEGNLVLGAEGRAGAERWLEWLVMLRQDQKLLASLDGIAVNNALMAQQALLTIDWAHTLPNYQALWGPDLGVAILPRLSDAQRDPQPYVQSDVISLNARLVDAAEQRAALDFVRYLLAEESQREFLRVGKQPTRLNLRLDGDTPEMEAARVFRAQARQGQPMPNSRAANDVVKDVLEQMQTTVLRGLATPAEAVTRADVLIRERLGLPPVP